MKKVEIKGIIPPIITPMNEDETINERNSGTRSTVRSGGAYTVCSHLGQTGRDTY